MAGGTCGALGEGTEGIGEPDGRVGVEKIPTGAVEAAAAAVVEARSVVLPILNCFAFAAGTLADCPR